MMKILKDSSVKLLIYEFSSQRQKALISCPFGKLEQVKDLFPEISSGNTLYFYATPNFVSDALEDKGFATNLSFAKLHILVVTGITERFKTLEEFCSSIPPEHKAFIKKFLLFSKTLLETGNYIVDIQPTVLKDHISDSPKGIFYLDAKGKLGYFTSQKIIIVSKEGEYCLRLLKDIGFKDIPLNRLDIIGVDTEQNMNLLIVQKNDRMINTFKKTSDTTYKNTGNRYYLTSSLFNLPFDLKLLNKVTSIKFEDKIKYLKAIYENLKLPIIDIFSADSCIYILASQEGITCIYKVESAKIQLIVETLDIKTPSSFVYLYCLDSFLIAKADQLYLVKPDLPNTLNVTDNFSQEERFEAYGDIIAVTGINIDKSKDIIAIAQEGRITLYELTVYKCQRN